MLYFEEEYYNISIINNMKKRIGIFHFIKYLIKYLIYKPEKNNLYYLNIAFLHCLLRKKGKYKC